VSAWYLLPLALICVVIVIVLTIGTDDGRKTVYCDRGGHILAIPDAPDQHYVVKCVRTRP